MPLPGAKLKKKISDNQSQEMSGLEKDIAAFNS
jgi:hypothetical protein